MEQRRLILLDTHVLLWWVNGDDRLSPAAQAAIDRERGGGLIASAISAWEIAMLVAHGRLALAMDVSALAAKLENLLRFIPIDREIAIRAVELPGPFHKDPADRMIVATARKLDIAIITADRKILDYPFARSVW